MANSVPTLTGLTTPVTFLENTVNAAPQIIDADVTFTDPDNNFDGGRLTVAGLLAQDTVAIRNQGTGAGEIGVSGGNVSFGGSVIGSFAGGAGSTLTVTFNAAATAAGIEALIENLTYANSSDAPAASRSFELKVTDAAGFAATIAPLAEQTGAANPFNGLDVGDRSTPSFADLDGDGDLDAVVGEYNGLLHYFENTGSATAPAFTARTGAANPLNAVNVGGYSAPSFADLDGDGDLDAVVGELFGTLHYFENTGSASAPAFTARTGAANPFAGVDVGSISVPSFADLDGDGDLDAVVGEGDGNLNYFENTGTAITAAFTERTGAANPFDGVVVGARSTPSFADLDGDGDLDAVVGEVYGILHYFENTGTAIAPAFTARTGAANPFDGVDVGFNSTPSFADLDGDGGVDAVVGASDGTLHLSANTTPHQPAPDFAEQTSAANPFNTVDVGELSTPSFADLDGDGDLDAVVGEGDGTLNYFENTGSASAPAFTARTGAANPFNGVDVGFYGTPSFADLDGDGDLDAVVGEYNGTLHYFENTGSAIAPAFIESIGAANPFDGVNAGYTSTPSFADLDGDGDLDAVVGSNYGTLHYFKNTGSAMAPAFTEQTGTANPFDGVNVGFSSAPSFADLDGDSDLDAVVGANDGTLRYFENTGSAIAAAFTARTGAANPFNGVDVGGSSAPSFADLDGDGDLDAIVGANDGTLNYFKNTGAGFTQVVNVTAQNDAATLSADVRNLTETDAAAAISSSGTLTISDPDSPATFVVQAGTIGSYGTFAITSAGAWTYTASSAHNEFAAGTTYTDTFPVAGADGTLTSVTINILGSNDAAVLTGLTTPVTFLENTVNAAAQIIDADVTFTDPDNNFNGGTLTVTGLLAQDTVAIRNQGTGAGEIGVSGGDVSFGGSVIGSFAGGAGSTLTVTFNAAATAAGIEALIENLTYANSSDAPTASRSLELKVTGAANPFNGVDLGGFSAPGFADLDGDGDLDAVVGEFEGNLNYFENTGSATAPAFTARTGAANPLDGVDVGIFSHPSFADLDGDGDLDAVVGERYGTLRYFENTGSAIAPAFTARTGAANPFNGVGVAGYSAPSFADLDGDGDLDAVVGEDDGTLHYFENTGTATAPAFTARDGAANPFNGVDVGELSKPSFADLDGDGDLDAVVGERYGALRYFQNTGTALAPAFTEQTGAANPLDGVDVGYTSTPSFADLDGDGDLDAVVGESSGTLRYFENTGAGFALVVNVTAQNDAAVLSPDARNLTETNAAAAISDSGTLTISDVDSPATFVAQTGTLGNYGTFAITSAGAWTYTASSAHNEFAAGTTYTDTFQVASADGTPTTVTINILGTNDAAVLSPDVRDLSETNVALATSGTLTVSDVDSPASFVAQAGTLGSYGTFAIDSAGAWTYTASSAHNEFAAGTTYTDTFQVASADGTLTSVTINIAGSNDAAVLTGLTTPVTFLENTVNAAAQIIDANITFTDPDNNFDGGTLTVAGLLAQDTVAIRNLGTGAGQIGVSGGNVTFGGSVIGSFAGGAGSTFTVTFNAAATAAGIEALIENLTYANSSDTPAASRSLELKVTDAAGVAAIAPAFTEQTGAANPFNGVDVGFESTPSFADLDGDGDLDAVVGEASGNLRYFENAGSATAPAFSERTGAANPFDGVDVGLESTPSFADLDGDGDLDAVVGEGDGILLYFENTGSAIAPAFTARTGAANPFDGIFVFHNSTPSFADLDGDGDLDAVVGEQHGPLRYFENTGTAIAPAFTERTGDANPFDGVNVGDFSAPSFADLDGDGDLDAVVGEGDGTLHLFENTGSATAPAFTALTGAANPFDGIDVGSLSTPSFADLDGDGDLDAVVGANDGTLHYFENTGSAIAPAFTEQTGAANPFNGVDVGFESTPSFADLDGDGDLDAVVGEASGNLRYFENAGSATAPAFSERTGAANPFDGVDVGLESTPSFADLDGDGDLDAVVGEGDGILLYFENTGSAIAPAFTARTGAANPFDGIFVFHNSTPSFADLDGDGDLDAVVGEQHGPLRYFENTGTAIAPAFTERTGDANPFDGVNVGDFSAPSFADLDGDGDLDAVVGEGDGTLRYFQNTGAGFTLVVNVTAQNDAAVLSTDVRNLTETNAAADISASGTLTISDPDSATTFVAQAGTAGSYGTFAIDSAGAWTYTASSAHNEFAAGTTYTDTFQVASADGTPTSVTINILGSNDAAVLSTDVRNLTETNAAADVSDSGTLTISDADSPATFVAQAGTAGSYGTFAINSAGAWTYTASSAHDAFVAGTTYTDTFQVASADGTPTSVTINIAGSNDAAVLSTDVRNLTETNAAADVSDSGTLTISDADSPATFVAQAGTAGSYGTFAINTAGAWTYTASSAHDEFAAGTTYTDTFSVAGSDGTLTSVTINIAGSNDAAVLSADVRNLTETNTAADISATGTLTNSDPDSAATFVAQAGTLGSYGTFAITSAGAWTYTASSAHNEFAAGTTYTDTFPVASADGAPTSVTINILGSNDAAVLSADVRNPTETNAAADISSSGTLTISDADSAATFVAQAGTAGSYGTFAIDTAGGWTYTASSAHDAFVAGTTYTDTFQVASADGTPTSVTINILGTSDAAASHDFSSDSKSDILWQSSNGTAAVWLLDGTNVTFAGQIGSFNPGLGWHIKDTGDFNGDSKSDIVWQHDNGTAALWLLDGTNVTFAGQIGPFNPGPAWHIEGTGDFNGDGKDDIIWQGDNGTAAMWLMDGTNATFAGAVGSFNPGPTWHIEGTGDFNGDGKDDIIWQGDNGTAAMWLMDGTNVTFAGAVGSNPGPSWHIEGTGDFNGDGKSDILWQGQDGTPAIWLMDGTNVTFAGAVGPFNPGPSWHIEGTGDFNGDSKADILWQHDDGRPVIWTMDGTNVVSIGAAGSFNPGSDWHVII